MSTHRVYLPLILGSTRIGRQSPKVAQFLLARMQQQPQIETELLDLRDWNFPLLEERLRLTETPPPGVREFSAKLERAHGLVLISPEYNGGYPGVLKNVLDYFGPSEYRRKPFGIVTVSSGGFGGMHCLSQLRLVALGLGGFPIPAALPISHVQQSFTETGVPTDPALAERADRFLAELRWFAEAVARQQASE